MRKMLRLESENPPGNEYRLAALVKKELKAISLKVKTYEFAKSRPNVVGILKGKVGKQSILLTPHLDTVPAGAGWRFNPYAAKIYRGRIYGRGATDCKGNLASSLEALRSLRQDNIKLNKDIIFAATVDEETGSDKGIKPLIEKRILKPDFCLILDSDEFDIVVAQKGLIHFKVKIFGKKAHGAYPDRGINAIEIASRIITQLKSYKFKYSPHPLLKKPTINIGTIKGGDKVNMVADFCEFEVDLRFLPGMTAQNILNEIKKIIKANAKKFKLEINGLQKPSIIKKDNPLIKTLIKVNKRLRGHFRLKGSEGATVISFFNEKAIPAVATGFGSRNQAHATDEFVLIDNLYKGAKLLEEFLKEFDKVEAN
ncbi:MAG: M20 family metallopeptidase [Candidatus Omnitrophota bacterium]|nr:M20 family metallopeptidase [Candidatus Omnitrophota bacterium]